MNYTSKNKKYQWNKLHPQWSQSSLKHVQLDAMVIEGEITKTNEVKDILKGGPYIWLGNTIIRRKEYLYIFIEYLLAAGKFKAALNWYDQHYSRHPSEDIIYNTLHLYYNENKIIKNISELKKLQVDMGIFALAPVAIAKMLFLDDKLTEEFIKNIDFSSLLRHSGINLARFYATILGDMDNAKKIFNDAIYLVSHVKSSNTKVGSKNHVRIDWADIATGCIDIFNDKKNAKKYMEKTWLLENNTVMWGKYANLWNAFFGDKDGSRLCLEKIDEICDECEEYASLATNWITIFRDEKKAEESLIKGEKYIESDDPDPWNYLAEFWFDLFGDLDNARRCFKIAEKLAKHYYSFSGLAESCQNIFNDPEKAEYYKKIAAELKKKEKGQSTNDEEWQSLFNPN